MMFIQQRWDILSQDPMKSTAYAMLVLLSIAVIAWFVFSKRKFSDDKFVFLLVVICTWAVILVNPMKTQPVEVLEEDLYDVELLGNVLYSSDELNVKVKMPDGSERTLDFGKLDIVLEEGIETHRLEVSPYIVEEIYLHRTAYEREEEYTLYIKSGE
jgi:hypothetical protein